MKKMSNTYIPSDWEKGYEEGKQEERKAIVEWLGSIWVGRDCDRALLAGIIESITNEDHHWRRRK